MLDQLFESPITLQHHLNSPLLESRLCYLNYCAERGASKHYLQQLAYEMLNIIDCLHLDRVIDPINISEIASAANAWINRKLRPPHMKHGQRAKELFTSVAINWLRFIGRLRPQQVLHPYSSMIDDFISYVSNERGFSKTSLPVLRSYIESFLDKLYSQNCPLSELTIAEIQDFIALKSKLGWARTTIKKYSYSLRTFFRYAEMRGWCKPGLSEAIISPCIFKETTLPVGPSWDIVQRLIASIGQSKPLDIRDRAIVMLIAVYGLRSIEVSNLRIEEIDWNKEQIVIRHAKQGATQPYPLSGTVGEAILHYLKEVRPRSCRYREVFLTIRSPIQPLSWHRLHGIVRDRLLSLKIPLKHYGSHSLRHACASHLLAEGLSLKEIGDYLGHRNPDSTRIYAKVDLAGLREVADFSLGGLL